MTCPQCHNATVTEVTAENAPSRCYRCQSCNHQFDQLDLELVPEWQKPYVPPEERPEVTKGKAARSIETLH